MSEKMFWVFKTLCYVDGQLQDITPKTEIKGRRFRCRAMVCSSLVLDNRHEGGVACTELRVDLHNMFMNGILYGAPFDVVNNIQDTCLREDACGLGKVVTVLVLGCRRDRSRKLSGTCRQRQ